MDFANYVPLSLCHLCTLPAKIPQEESKQFLSLYYENNLNKLFVNFLENADMSDAEVEALKNMLEKKKGETNA